MKIRFIFQLVALLSLLIIAAALQRIYLIRYHTVSERDPAPQEQTRKLLKVMPVHELILQEVTLDIITQARFDERGKPILYFASAGTFGQTQSKSVLFRGCVQIRYGVDMTERRLEVTSDDNGSILLKLPEPRIIGNPLILTEEPYQSRILDVQGEGWWAGRIARAEVTNQIAQAYVANAATLCQGLGLEQKTRERAEQVLRAFLRPVMDGRQLIIQWEEKTTDEAVNQKQQGETHYVDDENVGEHILDSVGGGGSDFWDTVDDELFAACTDDGDINGDDNGPPGYAEFNIAGEPFGDL